MKIPVLEGMIDRRILINYRVDPEVLNSNLPPPFRPKIVGGFGIAGVCLIRLTQIRPRRLPAFVGITSENAAHRIAVRWPEAGGEREGVYIPRRDTSSWLTTRVGGWLFPGLHQRSRFSVDEGGGRYSVRFESQDGGAGVEVVAHSAADFPAGSVFSDLHEASEFFASGSMGYSATEESGVYDGLELRSLTWQVEPLEAERVRSGYFENRELFPEGSLEFDCALLMQQIAHEWHGHAPLMGSDG